MEDGPKKSESTPSVYVFVCGGGNACMHDAYFVMLFYSSLMAYGSACMLVAIL